MKQCSVFYTVGCALIKQLCSCRPTWLILSILHVKHCTCILM